jgi:hypothetical protein
MSKLIDKLITDRTENDVALAASLKSKKYINMSAAEKDVYNSGKGAYRYTDLNRVGKACADLYLIATGAGYTVPNYTALRTDWHEKERPTPAEMAQYLATVNALKTAFNASQQAPANMRHITYEDANNIEKLLNEIDGIFYKMKSVYLFSQISRLHSTSYCGYAVYIPEYKDPFDFNAVDFTYTSFGM